MLQRMLVDRFKVALHHEQKEMPVFNLTVAEHGLKMKQSPPDRMPAPRDPWAIASYTVGEDG